MNYMNNQSVTDVYELGAGKVLSGLVKRSFKEINTASIYTPTDIEELAKNLS